ncbi:hypothetical protein CDD83_5854 [Cordyceps sp. RAO-2017]|nr:hypothetical protein CDD83_5854 [Cordyceps sp. RAO-2017]
MRPFGSTPVTSNAPPPLCMDQLAIQPGSRAGYRRGGSRRSTDIGTAVSCPEHGPTLRSDSLRRQPRESSGAAKRRADSREKEASRPCIATGWLRAARPVGPSVYPDSFKCTARLTLRLCTSLVRPRVSKIPLCDALHDPKDPSPCQRPPPFPWPALRQAVVSKATLGARCGMAVNPRCPSHPEPRPQPDGVWQAPFQNRSSVSGLDLKRLGGIRSVSRQLETQARPPRRPSLSHQGRPTHDASWAPHPRSRNALWPRSPRPATAAPVARRAAMGGLVYRAVTPFLGNTAATALQRSALASCARVLGPSISFPASAGLRHQQPGGERRSGRPSCSSFDDDTKDTGRYLICDRSSLRRPRKESGQALEAGQCCYCPDLDRFGC